MSTSEQEFGYNQEGHCSQFFTEDSKKFRGDNLASKTGFSVGGRLFSERYRNLSSSTTVSINGASIARNAPNITICRHRLRKRSTRGSWKSESSGRRCDSKLAVAAAQYLSKSIKIQLSLEKISVTQIGLFCEFPSHSTVETSFVSSLWHFSLAYDATVRSVLSK